jgi:hypothetical protein
VNAWRRFRNYWKVGVLLVGLVLAGPAVGHTFATRSSGSTAVAASGVVYHGVNQTLLQECIGKGQNCLVTVPGLVHCMRVYKICNQAAATENGVLSRPLAAGTHLMTASQVLQRLGTANPNVKRATAVMTTYGTLHAKDPALAASTTIDPGRPVYLVTEWFVKPVLVQGLYVPNGAPGSGYVTGAQYVVDAATGQITDWTP